jgi:hypothetical protein
MYYEGLFKSRMRKRTKKGGLAIKFHRTVYVRVKVIWPITSYDMAINIHIPRVHVQLAISVNSK